MSHEINYQSEQSSEGPARGGIARSDSSKARTGIKRKLDTKTIEFKYNAIMEVEKGQKSKAQIARDLEISSSTLSTWLKNADSIKEGLLTYSPKRQRLKCGKWDELETALVKWVRLARDKGAVLSGPTIQTKAEQFASSLGIGDFRASTGWLDRFKERNGIVFRSINGESKSVDDSSSAMEEWQQNRTALLQNYKPEDVYNADETGLFFKMLPDKTMDFKSVDCNGGKRSKERLTVMVCANMTGTDKLPLLVIGKSAKPRCFTKNVKTLPTNYTNNKKAWMTGEMFETWARNVDRQMQKKNRRIALIVDNAPCHPKLKNLTNIELVFLPPNTTSKTQPMDQGVIQNLKVHYRKRVVLRQLSAIDGDREFSITVLCALRLLQQSLECVTPTTIANCFRHAGFTVPDSYVQDDDENDELDDIPLARLASMGTSSAMLGTFLEFDDSEAPTSQTATDDDIISEVLEARTENSQNNSLDDEDDDDIQPTPPPTADQAMEALETLRAYFETIEKTQTESKLLCAFSRTVIRQKMSNINKFKQLSITDFARNVNQ